MDKTTTELDGYNRSRVKFYVDKFHVVDHPLEVVRSIWNRTKHNDMDPALKRGLIKAILEIHQENFNLYVKVMKG